MSKFWTAMGVIAGLAALGVAAVRRLPELEFPEEKLARLERERRDRSRS